MSEGWSNNDAFAGIVENGDLLCAIPGGIVVTAADPQFRLLFANPGYYAMVGYTKEEHHKLFKGVGAATLYPDNAQAAVAAAQAQLAAQGAFHVNAKLFHKTKGYIWAHFSGKLHVATTPKEADRVFITIVDISEHQHTVESLEKEKAFNDLLASLSEESFFDCDLHSGTMRYSKNFATSLGMEHLPTDFVAAFQLLGLLPPNYQHQQGANIVDSLPDALEKELHFTLPNGAPIWYLCRCNVQNSANGKPLRIVGKLFDITRHKIQIDELSHLAQLDQLTGLFNKTTTEDHIKDILNMRRLHDDNCALMIIDIDNFKTVNDRLGHLYGDAVLTQLAEHLKSLFRAEDVVGRVGGDEFFVFLKSYRSTKVLTQKANEIRGLFHKTYAEGDTFVTISASIGIALCPEHCAEFDGLYKKADAALYDAKAMGKNAVSFFRPDLTHAYTSARTEIDANALKKSFKNNRIEYVFRLLYDSENPVSSIQAVLQLVTESYGFSRGYIFETSIDGTTTSNTFEWRTDHVTAEIANLQNVPIAAVATANRSFLDTGMFILKSVRSLPKIEREVLEPQGILSMFQFGVIDKGQLMGFIGFDHCELEQIPSDVEIDEICTVCHVLATFLLKHRSGEREIRHHESLELVIDHLDRYIYAIEKDSYRVLYENRQVTRLTGKSALGQPCYKAYGKGTAPCAGCPALALAKQPFSKNATSLAKTLNNRLLLEARPMLWTNNKEAVLLFGAVDNVICGGTHE